MVQYYVEEIGQPDHLRLVSNSDLFTPSGRTKVKVIATQELLDFLGKQGLPWDVFRTGRKPISEAHNRQKTPLFAKSIEPHALRRK